MDQHQERGLRHSVRLDASVTRQGGLEVPAVVTDLSLDGCCLLGQFQIGERLTVKIPKVGSLAGEVRWAFMGRAGVRFLSDTQKKLDQRGAAAIEYALLAGLVALALIASFTRLGGEVETEFHNVGNAFADGTKYDL